MSIDDALKNYNIAVRKLAEEEDIGEGITKVGYIKLGDREEIPIFKRIHKPQVCITVQGQAYMVNKEEAKEIYATINDFLIEDEEF